MRADTDLAVLPVSPLAEKTTMKSACCMLVGELMYIAINTRPEISYAVNKCSRYMTKATKAHYEVLKHIHLSFNSNSTRKRQRKGTVFDHRLQIEKKLLK